MANDSAYLAANLTIGLLGGSFNPAHQGHLDITHAARRALRLDRVWWLVSPQNPLKSAADYMAFEDRHAHAATLAEGRSWLRVSDIENHIGTRYTADTLGVLKTRFPHTRFVWIMGADNLAGFHRWQEWQKIAALVPICVISRPGYDLKALNSVAARTFGAERVMPRDAESLANRKPPAWLFLPTVHNPLSATAIRKSNQTL